MSAPAIVWFRQDLRLDDNPALLRALAGGRAVIPVYIWSPEEEGPWAPGAASRWWLHRSLAALTRDVERRGSRLILRRGSAEAALRELLDETGAAAVYWNRRYEPAAITRDSSIRKALEGDGVSAKSCNASLLWEPWDTLKPDGAPYKVFTPYWNACRKRDPPDPEPAPSRLPAVPTTIASDDLASFALEPSIDWAGGLRDAWKPGEAAAQAALQRFLEDAVEEYSQARDIPSVRGTSRLSPYLHFGEISPRRIWRTVFDAGPSAWPYLRQLVWREFSYSLLYHFPTTPLEPLRREFGDFPWSDDGRALRRWQRGQTGYPIVDAGMRELWTTGWMHNRVRMVAASFLVKHLLLPWQEGAKWFWDTLADADLANNTMGWQWTAGCGADAAPYFRIFNPVAQGEKFDASGAYVRRWVPELAGISDKWLHKPWESPPDDLRAAGVELGGSYPRPIVNHAEARGRALAAYETIKRR